MYNLIKKLGEEILDRIYPSDIYCICCGKIIDWSRTYRLCDSCMESMKWVADRTCDKCGKRLSDSNPGNRCFNCREHGHAFDRGYTCTEYGAHERAIVFGLKYDERTDISRTIGEIMADRMTAEFQDELPSRYDLIVPVPITTRKRLQRGYNQADLIAHYFAEESGLVYRGEVLDRVRETDVMRSLGPDERRANIRGCFEVRDYCKSAIKGAKCLVIDDIYTTGATIDEVAEVLKNNGADKVDFLSFASGADVVKS